MKRRNLLLVAGLLLLATVGTVIVVISWPDQPPTQPTVYANVSRNVRVCVAGTSARNTAQLWNAVESAATNEPINAQQHIAPDPTPDEVASFLNGLIALHCRLIITTGKDMHGPATIVARNNLHQAFATDDDTITLPNVQHIQTQSSVATVIHAALG